MSDDIATLTSWAKHWFQYHINFLSSVSLSIISHFHRSTTLPKNHCFVDGNKRIALIAVYTFLAINGIELIASETDAASFFLDLAASFGTQEEDMNRLANWLQINSEPIVD